MNIKTIYSYLFLFLLVELSSCLPSFDTKQEKEEKKEKKEIFSYPEVNIPLSLKQKSTWKESSSISAKALIESQYLIFELDLSKINTKALPVHNKDTFRTTVIYFEFTHNGESIPIAISKQKHRWMYRNGFDTQADSILLFTSGENTIGYNSSISVAVPMYVFEHFKAGTQLNLQARIWQDYFLSDRKEKMVEQNKVKYPFSYKDTLKTKLIDNIYSFTLTVPEIYKTEFLCDSIILENDSAWTPYGSDNTLFRSTLPDIYFALEDYAGNLQSSSDVEKSTSKFLIGDTLAFYHYKESEPFYLSVYDFDVLSKNDLLGEWNGKLGEMKNNQRYKLKFGHVAAFYIRKRYFGRVN